MHVERGDKHVMAWSGVLQGLLWWPQAGLLKRGRAVGTSAAVAGQSFALGPAPPCNHAMGVIANILDGAGGGIVATSPQLPQAFYPLAQQFQVWPGERLQV